MCNQPKSVNTSGRCRPCHTRAIAANREEEHKAELHFGEPRYDVAPHGCPRCKTRAKILRKVEGLNIPVCDKCVNEIRAAIDNGGDPLPTEGEPRQVQTLIVDRVQLMRGRERTAKQQPKRLDGDRLLLDSIDREKNKQDTASMVAQLNKVPVDPTPVDISNLENDDRFQGNEADMETISMESIMARAGAEDAPAPPTTPAKGNRRASEKSGGKKRTSVQGRGKTRIKGDDD